MADGTDITGGQSSRPKDSRLRPWCLGSIDVGFVLASQQWATILLTIFLVVIPELAISHSKRSIVRHRSFELYDATISYPLAARDTIPSWAAFAIPFILLVLTVLMGEFLLSSRLHAHINDALAAAVHFIVDSVAAFAVAVFVQIATKTGVGYLRPDWLARCQPEAAAGYSFALQYGQPTEPVCGSTDAALLTDGRSSFPSGHTTMSSVFEFYTAGYFLWCLYSRNRRAPKQAAAPPGARRSWYSMFLTDLGHAVALYWILLNVGVSWAIAATRVVDNRHHPADIVAGFILGATVAIIFLLRSIPTLRLLPLYNRTTEYQFGDQHGVGHEQQELAELGAANGPPHPAHPPTAMPGAVLPGQVQH